MKEKSFFLTNYSNKKGKKELIVDEDELNSLTVFLHVSFIIFLFYFYFYFYFSFLIHFKIFFFIPQFSHFSLLFFSLSGITSKIQN